MQASSVKTRMINKQPITTTLVGMNVAVYVVMVLTGVSPVNPTIPQLLKWGANAGPLSLGAEPWRMLASNYVHAGIIHIALNMWCLWNLGFLGGASLRSLDVRIDLHVLRSRGQLGQPVVASDGGRRGRLGSNFRIGRSFNRGTLSWPFTDFQAGDSGHAKKPAHLCWVQSVLWRGGAGESITRLILVAWWRD